MWIVDLFKSIPDVIWAAIIAAGISLESVRQTNKDNRLQLEERLKHDSDQRNREREMALRRDVYVPAAEGINRLVRLIYSLTNLSLTDQQIDSEMKESSAAIAKLQIVGSNSLIAAANKFMYEFNLSYLKLILKRAPLIERSNKAGSINGLLAKINQDQERLIEYMRQSNMAGNANHSALETVNKSFQYGQEQHQKLIEQLRQLETEQREESLQFSEQTMNEGSKVADLVPALIFAGRRDLELKVNEPDYMAQHRMYMEKSRDAFMQFLGNVRKI